MAHAISLIGTRSLRERGNKYNHTLVSLILF